MNARLLEIAKRVNWYADPSRLLGDADRFLVHVMARASTDDIVEVQRHYSREAFKKALLRAPSGLFSDRAWAYWSLVLRGDADLQSPQRFPDARRLDWRKHKS